MAKLKVKNVATNFLNKGYNMITFENGTNCITTDNSVTIGTEIEDTQVKTTISGSVPQYNFDGTIVAQNKQAANKSLTATYAAAVLEHQNPESAAKALMLLKEMGL